MFESEKLKRKLKDWEITQEEFINEYWKIYKQKKII